MTQPLDLAPIRARHRAATPGDWYLQPNHGPNFVSSEVNGYERGVGALDFGSEDNTGAMADRAFVLAAHTDMGQLLAEVTRLRAIDKQETLRAELATARQRAELAEARLAAVLALLPADPAEDINASWIPLRHIRAALNLPAPAAGSAG
ncbi:hypothetical protein KCMC57_64850 (plasmid) [Kitasatospora sp. CMC57]|uniref:Uncharacterized protein n=1 Tax=Kitasatospora sp. CMC57 TaxID=3231513 RepID=A0AB33K5T5_9ACTN